MLETMNISASIKGTIDIIQMKIINFKLKSKDISFIRDHLKRLKGYRCESDI